MEEQNKFFTEDCNRAMNEAIKLAVKRHYEFVTIDTFLMFIAQTPRGREIFEAMNLNVDNFCEHVSRFLEDNIPKIVDSSEPPQWTVQLRSLCKQATIIQKASKKDKVDEGYILVALFKFTPDDCYTLNYFHSFDVNRKNIMEYVSANIKKSDSTDKSVKDNTKNALHKYAILLNKKSKDGEIDPVIGRESEVERAIEILCQRRKNNPLLVGEPGVGKTAIAEGLAKKIADGKAPEAIAKLQIYSLDMPAVLAGTKYRGDFEERLKQIIKEASSDPNIALFIDELHTIIGTGSGTGTMDASNILKPALSSGKLKVIGATTYEEYRKHVEKEAALSRRFQKIDVEEPSAEKALEILKGLKKSYEDFHGVKYTEDALQVAVAMTVKYVNDRRLPDKAIDVLDMAGSQVKLSGKKVDIDEEKIKQVVASMARIPVDTIKETEKDKLRNLEANLKEEVFGQELAVQRTADSIIYSRANLLRREKPIASFLFAGPSGVGKTELAKQLSIKLGVPLIRFDMSEYMEKHTVSKLVGAPPGYVGYDQAGQLTESIRKNPHCVLLLDEIEKAHPDIFNILLQVMDYATLTDNDGKKADFKNVIIIMTTNLGAGEISKAKIGFTKTDTEQKDREAQVKKAFSPEFYNRLDSVVQFNALDTTNIKKVVQKHTKKLQESLLEKAVVSTFTPEALDFIAKEGFDEKMGARPIERFIEKNIAQVLSKEVLFGRLENGGEIKVEVKDAKLHIEYVPVAEVQITKKVEDNVAATVKTVKRVRRKKQQE